MAVKRMTIVPEVMTTEQAAKYLQVNIETLKKQLRAGKIPGMKVGRAWRIHKAALDAALGGRPADAEQEHR